MPCRRRLRANEREREATTLCFWGRRKAAHHGPTLVSHLPAAAGAARAPPEITIMAVTASYIPTSKLLSVFGDNASNNLTISRNAAGTLLVNGGAVNIKGGTATVAN